MPANGLVLDSLDSRTIRFVAGWKCIMRKGKAHSDRARRRIRRVERTSDRVVHRYFT